MFYDTENTETREKNRRVYSTELINNIIRDKNMGYDVPMDAFFGKDPGLRAPNITFKLTPEEQAEWERCYLDPLYFIEHYCKFKVDGIDRLVELRDYQKEAIKLVTDEYYNEEIDEIVPTNRNVIWMASRQTGKCNCFISNTLQRSVKGIHEVKIGDFYNKNSVSTTFDKLISPLYHLYAKSTNRLWRGVIGRMVQLLERIEYRGKDFDENDISKKIISSYKVNGVELLTDTGYKKATYVHKTQPYTVYRITFESGKVFECADNHIIYRCNCTDYNKNLGFTEVMCKDLNVGDMVRICDYYDDKGDVFNGYDAVKSIHKCGYKLCMYDVTIDSPNHRYFTDGVLSHNTTTICSILAHKLLFHEGHSVLIVCNREKTAVEVCSKLQGYFRNLPFYMKPGCVNFAKTGLILDNGSQVVTSSTTATSSIGFTIHTVLLDEFAHVPEAVVNQFWRSVYPTLSSSNISQCIITSTPNGTTNKFYEIWDGAIHHRNSFKYLKTPYYAVKAHSSDEWRRQMIADFGEEEFAQEFELQFNVNSKMLAKGDDLAYMDRIKKDYVPKRIISDNNLLKDENIVWHPDFDPNDIHPTDKFIMIVDLSEGNAVEGKVYKNKKKEPDFNSINIFRVRLNSISNFRKFSETSCGIADAFRYEQVGRYQCNTQDEKYAGRVCAALAFDLFEAHNKENVRVMVEMNFNGKSFVDAFMKHQEFTDGVLQKTYHTKPVPGERRNKKVGFKTTGNKEFFCLKGAKLLNQRRIIISDVATINQIQCFGYVKGKLEGIACHDDLSMPVFNHITRMLDDETYIEWLNEYFESLPYDKTKFYINQMIQLYDDEHSEMSDSEFAATYNIGANSSFGNGGVNLGGFNQPMVGEFPGFGQLR